MKIKIWQAFASNNSGSYTIVGSFDTPELATEVAAALRTMAGQHTAWLENARGTEFTEGVSPLGAFAQEHGLSWVSGRGTWDEWPEHDDSNIPAVIALGHQVLVHQVQHRLPDRGARRNLAGTGEARTHLHQGPRRGRRGGTPRRVRNLF